MQDYEKLQLEKIQVDQKIRRIMLQLPALNQEELYRVLHILHVLEKFKDKQTLLKRIVQILAEIDDLYDLNTFINAWKVMKLEKDNQDTSEYEHNNAEL